MSVDLQNLSADTGWEHASRDERADDPADTRLPEGRDATRRRRPASHVTARRTSTGLADDEVLDEFRRFRASGDRELRNRLVLHHRHLAEHHARRFAGRGEALGDLVQVALLALVKAVERFDPDYGVAFSAFAGPTVVGELRRHFRD